MVWFINLRCPLQDVRLNTFLRLLGQVGEMGSPVAGGPWAAKEAALFSAAPRPAEGGTACVVVRRPKFRAGRLSQYMTKPGLVSRAFLFLRYDHYLGASQQGLASDWAEYYHSGKTHVGAEGGCGRRVRVVFGVVAGGIPWPPASTSLVPHQTARSR